MYKILETRNVGLNIKQFVIEAPRIAHKHKPGQFVILRLHEKGERIPLTIKSSDPKAGTVTIVVQAIGKTTSLLNCLEAGDAILDIVGPLGHPSEIENYGTVVILAGSVGTAMALPTAYALKQAGNHVVFIEGSRSAEMVVFEDEARQASSETYMMTDDGSYGEQGLVTKKLDELIAAGRKIDFVLAVGPVPMMRAVARITGPLGIKTMVSLNSIMVDGTGMCGGCRVLLGDEEPVRLRGWAGVRRLQGQLRGFDAAQHHVSREGVRIAETLPGTQGRASGRTSRRIGREGEPSCLRKILFRLKRG